MGDDRRFLRLVNSGTRSKETNVKRKSNLVRTTCYGFGFSAILMLFFSVAWASGQNLVQVSQDPYTDPLAQHATEVEPVMVANGDTIVTALQVGRFQGTGSDNI